MLVKPGLTPGALVLPLGFGHLGHPLPQHGAVLLVAVVSPGEGGGVGQRGHNWEYCQEGGGQEERVPGEDGTRTEQDVGVLP